MRRRINNGDRLHAPVLAARMTKKSSKESHTSYERIIAEAPLLSLNQNKNGTGADLDDIVTCAKFGLEPANDVSPWPWSWP
jgi:hypothetical protein